ncbi:hypothetical protein R1sor_013753 [Riccia sorocarpa]|uniref:XS domain-containing protein n=1 Tax=Riccia sorocarpa TaxID=122646 RepID=A0ABD3HBC0_9MARC
MAVAEEEEAALKKLVISALAFYGLQVFHVFDGREFEPCFKLIKEDVDKETALHDFTEVVNTSGFGVLEKFVKEFCRPDQLATPPVVIPAEPQSQFVPDPVLNLLTSEMAVSENLNPTRVYPRIWAAFSTFTTDDFGHYVSSYCEPKAGEVDAKTNVGVQRRESLKVSIAKMEAGVLVQFMNTSYPAVSEAPFPPYSPTPTENNSPLRIQAGSGGESAPRKRNTANNSQEGSRQNGGKKPKLESTGRDHYKEREPGFWRRNLAKEWPHIFYEMEENHVSGTREEEELEEGSIGAYPPDELPAFIEMDTDDMNNMKDEPCERKHKRPRGTDEKVSGGTIQYDSSLKTMETDEAQRDHTEISEVKLARCAELREEDVKSEAGSNQTRFDIELEDSGHNRNKSSWPAPLYGDQARTKSSVTHLEPHEEEEEEEDACTHGPGKALHTCPICKKKEDIAFSKYSRLFEDDPAWKQKFLDGESLTCDICASKGKITTFSDVWLLLSHGWKGVDLKGPEHRGYAKAIENLIPLCEVGNTRTCHSSVGETSSSKLKRIWPPVVVLENTFKTTDQCQQDLSYLETEVSLRLKVLVNIDVHLLHKISVRGKFEGTIMVEFPPTRRGLHDANRLHHYFLQSGRSFHDWVRVRDERQSLIQSAAGAEESSDLVKTGEDGEVKSRIYFGYLATAKIMTRLDTFRKVVKWRFRNPVFVDTD